MSPTGPDGSRARESKKKHRDSIHNQEWVVPVDDQQIIAELRSALGAFESSTRQLRLRCALTAEVARFHGLRIEIFAREHPPPHFRVWCGGETANYRISDCKQLNGGLSRYYPVIRNWHAQNKMKLIDMWNSRRPTGCPVGKYQEL